MISPDVLRVHVHSRKLKKEEKRKRETKGNSRPEYLLSLNQRCVLLLF